jgi:hypothetical protein
MSKDHNYIFSKKIKLFEGIKERLIKKAKKKEFLNSESIIRNMLG